MDNKTIELLLNIKATIAEMTIPATEHNCARVIAIAKAIDERVAKLREENFDV